MEKYKVKVIEKFFDLEELCNRDLNEEFITSKERYEFLKENNVIKLIGIILEKTSEEKKTKKRTKNEEK